MARHYFQHICEMDLEGIVAKLKTGLYTPEATTWVKIRNTRYSQMEGRRELFEKRVQAVSVPCREERKEMFFE